MLTVYETNKFNSMITEMKIFELKPQLTKRNKVICINRLEDEIMLNVVLYQRLLKEIAKHILR